MNARKVAAQFAAYTWYEKTAGVKSPQEATRYARDNWPAFLPVVEEGLGKLLLRIALRQPRQRRRERRERRQLMTA